jgi:hypothetical protein
MTAKKIADAYVRAWLAGDVETAMSFVADDIVCQAPSGEITGRAAYRRFLEPFAKAVISSELINVLSDSEPDGGTGSERDRGKSHAAAVYVVETPFAKEFRAAEYLTVEGGKITQAITIFDRLPGAQAAR